MKSLNEFRLNESLTPDTPQPITQCYQQLIGAGLPQNVADMAIKESIVYISHWLQSPEGQKWSQNPANTQKWFGKGNQWLNIHSSLSASYDARKSLANTAHNVFNKFVNGGNGGSVQTSSSK